MHLLLLLSCTENDAVHSVRRPAFTATFDEDGLRAARPGQPGLSLALLGWGRGGALDGVEATTPHQDDRRWTWSHGALQAWWEDAPEGLRQGWTLDAAPPGAGLVTLEIAVEGATAQAWDDGAALIDHDGHSWWYTGLAAWDADEQPLPVWMEVAPDTLTIRVDDAEARYPITIDPILETASLTLEGESANSYFGVDLAPADINGDGRLDLIVGASGHSGSRGRAYVYHGAEGGLQSTATTTLSGESSSNYFGIKVDQAGDVNGDGYPDMMVGASGYSSNRGRVYIYHGSASGISSVSTTLSGESASATFGRAVAGLGDVNGDGYDDIMVGAPSYNSGRGRIYIYHGSAGGIGGFALSVDGEGLNASMGFAVAGAGDVNGDGYADALLGSQGYSSSRGRAYLYHGSASGLTLSATLSGEYTSDFFSHAVEGAGDINGDGYDDVVVGAPGYSVYRGRAYLYHGSASGLNTTATAWNGSTSGEMLGYTFAAGDVDSDGFSDVMTGAIDASSRGRLDVYHGSNSGLLLQSSVTGPSVNGYFTESIGAGDVNADGFDDVMVGAYAVSGLRGAVYVFHGYADADGDGYTAVEDCDDDDASVGLPATDGYTDADGDGFGDSSTYTVVCELIAGQAANGDDCDDADASVGGPTNWYTDGDGDGYGFNVIPACIQPAGTTSVSGDCDDTDAAFHPSATEFCDDPNDYDCDGVVSYADADGDGAAACVECDDTDAAAFPGNTETCDGVDNDCDGTTDTDAAAPPSWYADADGDGYGDAAVAAAQCEAPAGYVSDASDCDDADAAISPFGTEQCDGADNDCDGETDEATAGDAPTWYADEDGDGYGHPLMGTRACTQPSGYVATGTDCDDTDAALSPGNTEVCNGIDDDCSGIADESTAADASIWYADFDADSFGTNLVSLRLCTQPSGYVAATANPAEIDCDDGRDDIYPGATEVCDDADNDCDSSVDEEAADAIPWYADADGDSYGDSSVVVNDCDELEGYVSYETGAGWLPGPGGVGDCDDTDAEVSPASTEVCDDIDNNCDGEVDESSAVDAATWYADADGDDYGDATTTAPACEQPLGYVADSTDCDDGATTVHPGATETCNSTDDDCDGDIDEEAIDASAWYTDGDGDGYGDVTQMTLSCTQPTGAIADSNDCDDQAAAIHPDAPDTPDDGIDQDCDGADLSSDTGVDKGAGCACSSPGQGGAGLSGFLLVAGALLRRRRT